MSAPKRRALKMTLLSISLAGLAVSTDIRAETFVVTSIGDGGDASPGDGVCDDGSGDCTVRAAIEEANATAGTDTIAFSVDGAPPHTIRPSSGLPKVTDPVVIDGTTEPDFDGMPVIELDGSDAGFGGRALRIESGSSTVRGLVIHSFRSSGIRIEMNGNNVIQGNLIGLDVSGTVAMGNSGAGVFVNSNGNLIGGPSAQARNVISGHFGSAGVHIFASSGNLVQGNLIGTDITGTVDLGNEFDGVLIQAAAGNTIGGTGRGAGNVISGNGEHGVFLALDGTMNNVVLGNLIGTDVTGSSPLGNDGPGVHIDGLLDDVSDNTIGGTVAGAGNVISANNSVGIQIGGEGAAGTRVQGNLVGLDVTGSTALGNADAGIYLEAPDLTIGGTAAGAGNVISGNGRDGIRVSVSGSQILGNLIGTDATGTTAVPNASDGIVLNGPDNVVGDGSSGGRNVVSGNAGHGVLTLFSSGQSIRGNYIGTAADGSSPLGNGDHGVYIWTNGKGNTIGGVSSGEGNTIAFNVGAGVSLSSAAGAGNSIPGNSIFENGELGIDLAEDGVTSNDPGDGDEGPNDLQNFPVLTAATTTDQNISIEGTLNSRPNTMYRLEFFRSDACHPAGHGEGQTLVGSLDVSTDGAGDAEFSVTFDGAVPIGTSVTATATNPASGTSEFCACTPAGDGTPVRAASWGGIKSRFR